jgi:SAM-dependent methyltransferase
VRSSSATLSTPALSLSHRNCLSNADDTVPSNAYLRRTASANFAFGTWLDSGDAAHSIDVLDLCSSWVSHYPTDRQFGRVAGLGMNAKELEMNPQLTERSLRNLNKQPTLPYEDQAFDAITCTVSIDYLTDPLKVMAEAARVLRPGGVLALVISNRLFFSKAVALWTGKDDDEHIYTVASYIHYGAGRSLTEPEAVDLRPKRGKKDDPLYAIVASRRAG